MHAMLGQWAPPMERSKLCGITYAGESETTLPIFRKRLKTLVLASPIITLFLNLTLRQNPHSDGFEVALLLRPLQKMVIE